MAPAPRPRLAEWWFGEIALEDPFRIIHSKIAVAVSKMRCLRDEMSPIMSCVTSFQEVGRACVRAHLDRIEDFQHGTSQQAQLSIRKIPSEIALRVRVISARYISSWCMLVDSLTLGFFLRDFLIEVDYR